MIETIQSLIMSHMIEHTECNAHVRHATSNTRTKPDAIHLEHVHHGFGPVWDASSRILVLGTMPSPRSREEGFYYMHPRNRFWPIMEVLFSDVESDRIDTPGVTVQSRRNFALRHHIALWDVIASCDICGASDASIRNAIPNKIVPILRASHITHIYTTGTKAAQLYRKLIEPQLDEAGITISFTPLPSTSPANATMNLAQLTAIYRNAICKDNTDYATTSSSKASTCQWLG